MESARHGGSFARLGATIHAITMLIKYRAIIGRANSVWFHASGHEVRTAARMKMMKMAYLIRGEELQLRGS